MLPPGRMIFPPFFSFCVNSLGNPGERPFSHQQIVTEKNEQMGSDTIWIKAELQTVNELSVSRQRHCAMRDEVSLRT